MAPFPTSRSANGEANAGDEGTKEEGSSSEQDSMPKLRISGEALRKLVSEVRNQSFCERIQQIHALSDHQSHAQVRQQTGWEWQSVSQ